MQFRTGAIGLLLAALATSTANAQGPDETALASKLKHGGYVIVMRHAHAQDVPPGSAEADSADRNHERQLDAAGRTSASAMGAAIRALTVPIGAVWVCPTYRARETVRLAGLRGPRVAAELGDNGRSMQAANNGQAAWLRALANERPRPGTDTIIVTQYPNISAAFGDAAVGMKDGEALVFRPSGKAEPQEVGRIAIEQWPLLALQQKHQK